MYGTPRAAPDQRSTGSVTSIRNRPRTQRRDGRAAREMQTDHVGELRSQRPIRPTWKDDEPTVWRLPHAEIDFAVGGERAAVTESRFRKRERARGIDQPVLEPQLHLNGQRRRWRASQKVSPTHLHYSRPAINRSIACAVS